MQELENQFISSGGSFKEYKIGELFEVEGTRSLDEGKLSFLNEGVNFVGRVNDNNGVKGKIAKQNFEPNLPNTITVTVIGNYKYVKFQEKPYYCSQNINKLTPYFRINKNIALYFATHIQRFVSTYDGQQGGYKLNELSEHKIFIPTKNSQPDFDFMEEYIHVLEKERIHVLENYLQASGLDTYDLTDAEITALNRLRSGSIAFKEYKIGELFASQNGNFDIQQKHINGKGQLVVSSGIQNLGIIGKTDIAAKIFSKNTITIDMFGNVFYRDFSYKMVTHARIFSLKSVFENVNEKAVLYMSVCLQFLNKIFSYSNMASWEKINKQNISISLPTKNDQPDFDFMETYIHAVEKVVIKNVVTWKDKEIEKTKEVVA